MILISRSNIDRDRMPEPISTYFNEYSKRPLTTIQIKLKTAPFGVPDLALPRRILPKRRAVARFEMKPTRLSSRRI